MLLNGEWHKPVESIRKEHLRIKAVYVIVTLLLFSKLLPLLLGLCEGGFVGFFLGVCHFPEVVSLHVLCLVPEGLLSPGLSFKCEPQGVDDLSAYNLLDVALNSAQPELPDKREELDELLKLEIDPTLLRILLELVLGSLIPLRKIGLEKLQ